jgi:hypothetical protein
LFDWDDEGDFHGILRVLTDATLVAAHGQVKKPN